MKKVVTLLVVLFTTLGFGQTLIIPNSQDVPVGVNGVGISGFSLGSDFDSNTTYKVSLSITGNANGTFSINTTTGLTRDFGYSSWINITSVNFTGTPSNIENGLNSIKLNTSSTIDGLINLSVVITSQISGSYYNPDNGHIYKFVPGYISISSARSAALNSTYEGESGYLVNITSAAEQSFINNKVSAQNVWIGLTDEASEGTWKWMDGPEAGQVASYTNWCSSEPNNWGSGEDYVVTKWYGDGCWNDYGPPATLSTFSIGGYIIEYGDWTDPTQSTFSSTQQSQITFTQKDIPYIDYEFDFSSNIDPTDFQGRLFYTDSDGNLVSSYETTYLTLGSDGKVNVTDYITPSTSEIKATSTGGTVEYCVIYAYSSSAQTYRVGIDKRQFPSGFVFTDLKQLQLFDLWDGPVTYYRDDNYWAEYTIHTTTQFNYTSSSYYPTYLRSINLGRYALKSEFSFENAGSYGEYHFVIKNKTEQEISSLMDDIVTVSDVVAAFNELSGGGIDGGVKGDLNGIQLQNADVTLDNQFNYQDTYKLLKFLNGEDNLISDVTNLATFMRVVPESVYDNTTTSNWTTNDYQYTKRGTTNLSNSKVQFPKFRVTWVGDVNLSHSPGDIEIEISAKTSNPRSAKSPEDVTAYIETEYRDNKVYAKVNIDNLNDIAGIQLKLYYSNKLMLTSSTQKSSGTDFVADKGAYISFGSLSTEGKTLEGITQYEFEFETKQQLNGSLGLITVRGVEAVDTKNKIKTIRII